MSAKTVSIFCITYNHERFIAQALDSFLMQKTDFDFEIVVGEDCSTDNTRQILLAYKEKYPDKIKLVLSERNVGMHENAARTRAACDGKYIAIGEGDDYWIDRLKLQKQVGFLEANPDFVICHHNLEVIYEGETGEPRRHLFHSPDAPPPEVSTFEDLALFQRIATPSSVTRNRPTDDFPVWSGDVLNLDYVGHLFNAQYGKIKYINEVMGAYRIHGGGVWSKLTVMQRTLNGLETLERASAHFAPRGAAQFNRQKIKILADLSMFKFEEKEYKDFRKSYRNLLAKYKGQINKRLLAALTARYVLSFAPPGIGIYKQISDGLKHTFKNFTI